MKALSVRQPWASLIRSGSKTLEIRSRQTSYRGPLLIAASRFGEGTDDLPRGVAIAIVRLVGCRPFQPDDAQRAYRPWAPNLWAWQLELIHSLGCHQAVRGQLGIFSASPSLPQGACLISI